MNDNDVKAAQPQQTQPDFRELAERINTLLRSAAKVQKYLESELK